MRREKPSVYFNPIAQPISQIPAMKRMNQAMGRTLCKTPGRPDTCPFRGGAVPAGRALR